MYVAAPTNQPALKLDNRHRCGEDILWFLTNIFTHEASSIIRIKVEKQALWLHDAFITDMCLRVSKTHQTATVISPQLTYEMLTETNTMKLFCKCRRHMTRHPFNAWATNSNTGSQYCQFRKQDSYHTTGTRKESQLVWDVNAVSAGKYRCFGRGTAPLRNIGSYLRAAAP